MSMIVLENNKGFKWFRFSCNGVTVWTKGYAFVNNKLYKDNILLQYIYDNHKSIEGMLSFFNGSFAIVIESNDTIFFSSDRFRSFPLIYSNVNDFILSDECSAFSEIIIQEGLDHSFVEEFKIFGYVTGKDTLVKSIKQINAGHYIIFNKKDHSISDNIFYQFGYTRKDEIANLSNEEKIEILDSTLISAGKRLIDFLNGRTAVLFLSGGQDSRLLAILLKRLKYENVIAVTFGKRNNIETENARIVAESLNYKWIFVEYSDEDWKRILKQHEGDDFYEYAGQLISVAHMANYPALTKLVDQLPENSVMLYGGRYDVATGSWVPYRYFSDRTVSINEFKQFTICRHAANSWGNKRFIDKAFKSIDLDQGSTILSQTDAISLNYKYYSVERCAKFIRNTVRSFEFFGYEWYSFFEDLEIDDFWQAVDYKDYYKRNLHYLYAQKYMYPYTGIYSSVPKLNSANLKEKVLSVYTFNVLIRKIKSYSKVSNELLNSKDSLGYFTCFSSDEIKKFIKLYGYFLNGNRINEEKYLEILYKKYNIK